jgi:hypothetical protein
MVPAPQGCMPSASSFDGKLNPDLITLCKQPDGAAFGLRVRR